MTIADEFEELLKRAGPYIYLRVMGIDPEKRNWSLGGLVDHHPQLGAYWTGRLRGRFESGGFIPVMMIADDDGKPIAEAKAIGDAMKALSDRWRKEMGGWAAVKETKP